MRVKIKEIRVFAKLVLWQPHIPVAALPESLEGRFSKQYLPLAEAFELTTQDFTHCAFGILRHFAIGQPETLVN